MKNRLVSRETNVVVHDDEQFPRLLIGDAHAKLENAPERRGEDEGCFRGRDTRAA